MICFVLVPEIINSLGNRIREASDPKLKTQCPNASAMIFPCAKKDLADCLIRVVHSVPGLAFRSFRPVPFYLMEVQSDCWGRANGFYNSLNPGTPPTTVHQLARERMQAVPWNL